MHSNTAPTPAPVQRDSTGWWVHPGIPDAETLQKQGLSLKSWLAEHNLGYCVTLFEYDADEQLQKAYYEDGSPDLSGWVPSEPVGEGWFLLLIQDSDDGPLAVWVRDNAKASA